MAKQKNTVKFTRKDAPKPVRLENGTVELKMPVPYTLGVASPARISLGLVADQPLLVSSTKLELRKSFFAPGEDIVLEGTTRVRELTPLAIGERVAVAVPLFPGDFEVE